MAPFAHKIRDANVRALVRLPLWRGAPIRPPVKSGENIGCTLREHRSAGGGIGAHGPDRGCGLSASRYGHACRKHRPRDRHGARSETGGRQRRRFPAASCPRCCSACSPSAVSAGASGWPKTPKHSAFLVQLVVERKRHREESRSVVSIRLSSALRSLAPIGLGRPSRLFGPRAFTLTNSRKLCRRRGPRPNSTSLVLRIKREQLRMALTSRGDRVSARAWQNRYSPDRRSQGPRPIPNTRPRARSTGPISDFLDDVGEAVG